MISFNFFFEIYTFAVHQFQVNLGLGTKFYTHTKRSKILTL